MDYSSLDKKSKRKRRSKSPKKIQEKFGNLVVNSQNAQTDMGVGPDSPGISSL
jgi:hypothetical protein